MVDAGQARPAVAAHQAAFAVQVVDHLGGLFVRAGDQHIFTTQLQNALGAFRQLGVVLLIIFFQQQAPRFQTIRRQDGGLRQQQLAHGIHHVFIRQFVAAAGRQHWIEYQWYVGIIRDYFRNGSNILQAAQQADLECRDRHVFQHCARLVGHPFGIHRLHIVYTAGVLHGNGGNHGQRMATHAGNGQDVCLHAGPATGIGGGKGKNDRWNVGHDGRAYWL